MTSVVDGLGWAETKLDTIFRSVMKRKAWTDLVCIFTHDILNSHIEILSDDFLF